MIGALVAGLLVLDDSPSQFERELGFALPYPYSWQSSITPVEPIFVHCSEPAGSGCPHGQVSHWDYTGTVGRALYAPHWQDAPGFYALLEAYGWTPVEWQQVGPGNNGTNLIRIPVAYELTTRTDTGVCYRRLERDTGYLDAIGVSLHLYPCETE
ncbi:hypothetical protein [Maricaulis maris]|uniref:hypothetical protein n=1 Tax=Maricaulis maris TaxID=74318 RepID=UPI003B8B1FE5